MATLTKKSLAGLDIVPVQERSMFYNILIYGESGTGKTTLAGSADLVPSMRPVLFVDIEGGTQSLSHSYPEVDTVRITTWKQMQELYNALYEGNHPYKTVVLDSLTEIQKFNMYHIMEDATAKNSNLDPDVPSMREWGRNLEQIRRMVRGFRDLDMHTIFTALVKSDKDQKTGLIHNKPSLSGKMADEVAAFLDIVVYYYVKEVSIDGEDVMQRLLLTQKTDTTIAKDRSGRLAQVIQSPTMLEIHRQMTSANNTTNKDTE
ncbi:MAG: ATP-binding protein [Candidatus Saccharibacteria bacterium]|nr:ATP-binding protein [Candidatus Saccharibacteria bacterium]